MWYSVVYSLQINTLLSYTLVSALVLGIGITSDEYYWILDIGCLSWYRSNPTQNCTKELRNCCLWCAHKCALTIKQL